MGCILIRLDFRSPAGDRAVLFIKRLDDIHTAREKQANRLGKPIKEPIFAAGQDHLCTGCIFWKSVE